MPDFLAQILTSELSYNWATLLLRLACGIALLPYAIGKIKSRRQVKEFPAVLFFSSHTSFYVAMCMETFSSLGVIFGFLTRIAALCGFATMAVAANTHRPIATAPANPFALMFFVILILGPGAFSLDALIFGH